MPSGFRIESDFPSDLQKKLIKQVARRKNSNSVHVGQFNRFGHSGASLLIIYFFSSKPAGIPYLLKVTPIRKAQEEYEAIQKFHHMIPDAELEVMDHLFKERDARGEWGALLYKNHGSYGPGELAANPRALRNLISEPTSSAELVRTSLDNVFEKLNNVHSTFASGKVELRDEKRLGRYLRNDRAAVRINCVLGSNAGLDELRFQGADIINPLSFVKRLPRYGTLELSPIHGDLHPDNVILAQDGSPHLIDFGWTRESQDVLVDFVLLETSIRFNLFPRPINLEDHLYVDEALLLGHELDVSARTLCCEERREAYRRLASAVKTVRERAQKLLGPAFSMERYLLTQFIVLYGLLAYEEYEPYASTRALGMIAKRLSEAGRLSFCCD